MSALDKLKNKLQEVKGMGKEAAGKVSGDAALEHEGRGDQIRSSVKEAGEKLKDAAESLRDGLKGDASDDS